MDTIYEARAFALDILEPKLQSILAEPTASIFDSARTIDRKTSEAYKAEGFRIIWRYLNECRIYECQLKDVRFSDFIDWLLYNAMLVKERTWKKYKHCVLHLLLSLDLPQALSAAQYLACAVTHFDENGRTQTIREAGDRSGVVKYFLKDDLTTLLLHLIVDSRGEFRRRLADLLIASVHTAVRPVEWRATFVSNVNDQNAPEGVRNILFVVNAKATNARGNAAIRGIDITFLTPEKKHAIIRTVKFATELAEKGLYEGKFLKRFTQMMYDVTISLWPNDSTRAYSLLSCRHQASANLKKRLQIMEVAAIMGHATIAVTNRSYAPMRDAWVLSAEDQTVLPLQDEVKRIQKRVDRARMTIELRERIKLSHQLVSSPRFL